MSGDDTHPECIETHPECIDIPGGGARTNIDWYVYDFVTSNTTNAVLCVNIFAQRDKIEYDTESRKIQAGKQELEAVDILAWGRVTKYPAYFHKPA